MSLHARRRSSASRAKPLLLLLAAKRAGSGGESGRGSGGASGGGGIAAGAAAAAAGRAGTCLYVGQLELVKLRTKLERQLLISLPRRLAELFSVESADAELLQLSLVGAGSRGSPQA